MITLRIRLAYLALIVALVLQVGAGAGLLRASSEASALALRSRPFMASLVLAHVAHVRAGDPITFEPVYAHQFILNDYGMVTNSLWLSDWTRLIVPMLVYEKATWGTGIYPRTVIFVPLFGARSQHVGGSAFPVEGVVLLNERMVLDERWNDERRALTTLTHELIHIQGGYFMRFIDGSSVDLEARTTAATLEVMAAMCNYGNELACLGFWDEIESLARSDLAQRFADIGREDIYNLVANALWRDTPEERAYRKSYRFWSEAPEERERLRQSYALIPWREFVIPGVLHNALLDTGNAYPTGTGSFRVLGMPFDDSADLLGRLLFFIEWLE